MAGAATVTVLFTDLVGSTESMGRMGDQRFDNMRRAHFGGLRDAVAACGGREVKNTGDGLMVTFSSCSDAARCAVAMQQATGRLAREHPDWPVSIRVGVAVGEAITDDGDWFGTPVVEAARLCADAEAGEVLTTELVRLLAAGHSDVTFESAGVRRLRGLADPVTASRVLWAPASVDVPLPAPLVGPRGFFVGRRPEQARLRALWSAAGAGEHQVVLVGGEPGVGKTRLATELARDASAAGASVLFGRCDDPPLPYQPFAEALGHLVHAAPLDVLEAHVHQFGGEIGRLVPDLADRVPELAAPAATADPDAERYRLFEAVVSLLRATAERGPVVLVVDDLHWAATPTLLLLRHIARAADPLSLLVVATYRDTDLDRTHPLAAMLADLRREPAVERVTLSGLSADEVLAFVAAAAEDEVVDDDRRALAEAVHRETDGNPFFVGQVLRHLVETEAVRRDEDGRWHIVRAIDDVGLPEGVRDVIGRRLDRLAPATNRALAVAALIGGEFDLRVLEAVPDAFGRAGEPVDLLDVLDEGLEARVVEELPAAPGRYAFVHSLVRQTLASELTAARRTRLHRQIGEAIEAFAGADVDAHLAALAHHFGEAAAIGDEVARKAARYAARAAWRAIALLAGEEALALADRGLQALEEVHTVDPSLVAELKVAKAEAYGALYDFRHLTSAARDAAAAARLAGDRAMLGRAAVLAAHWRRAGMADPELDALVDEALAVAPDDEVLRAQLLAASLVGRSIGLGQADAATLAGEVWDTARRSGDVRALSMATLARSWTLMPTGDIETERQMSEELLELGRETGQLQPTLQAMLVLARVHLATGDRARLVELVDRGERWARDLRLRGLEATVSTWRAQLAMADGRFDEAPALIDAALALNPDHPNSQNSWAAQLLWLRHEQGRLAELVPVLEEGARLYPGIPGYGALLALAYLRAGEHDAAARAVAAFAEDGFEALARNFTAAPGLAALAEVAVTLGLHEHVPVLRRRLEPFSGQLVVVAVALTAHGAADRAIAMLAHAGGDLDEADARFGAALDLEERFESPALAARTRYWWARSLLTRTEADARSRGAALLHAAGETARRLGMAELANSVGELAASTRV